MQKIKLTSFLVVLGFVLVSCQGASPADSQSHIGDIQGISQRAANLPVLDPEASLPSPGAAELGTVLGNDPGTASLISDLEASEQAALKATVADLQAFLSPTSNALIFASLESSPFMTSTVLIPPSAQQLSSGGSLLIHKGKPSVNQSAEKGLSPASMIGLLSGMFTDMFSVPTAFPTHSFTQTETKGDVTTDMSMEIGKSEDGSSHFGMGMQSEGTNNGTSVKTDLSAVVDGQRCPTAEGQVSFSIKARIGSQSGGTGTTQDLTTFVRAIVNDDAEIASSTFDLIQGTTQVKGGQTVYLETGETVKYGQDYTGFTESNWHVNQHTDNATREDQINMEPPGLKAALELGIASLESAKYAWQNGKCTKIVAVSPGTVQPGSTSAIPVNVISIFDGSNAPSKLTAALKGGESIRPATLAKTPGNLSYVAPGENGKSATITLTATSRRGKATLDLSANTGGSAYSVSGESNQVSFNGQICSLEKPFVIDATFPGGGSATTTFTPDSAAGGKTTVTGGGGDCKQTGSGSYTVTTNADGSRTLKWTTTDTLTCPNIKQTRTGTFSLPLTLAPDATCK